MTSSLLVSVDLEDVHGHAAANSRLPQLTERILRFLHDTNSMATFFVVGRIAESFPSLIRDVSNEGHEIAFHSHEHAPLPQHTRASFRDDVKRGLDALDSAGISTIAGYRAPFFSLTPATVWATEILCELGFLYDSSIVPVWNPVYGFPNYPRNMERWPCGLWEVPMATFRFGSRMGIPVAGGTYLRLLPYWFIEATLARLQRSGWPICLYFHPYDIDVGGGLNRAFPGNPLFSSLLSLGRGRTLPRLGRILCAARSLRIVDYVSQRAGAAPPTSFT